MPVSVTCGGSGCLIIAAHPDMNTAAKANNTGACRRPTLIVRLGARGIMLYLIHSMQ
jgi:hypothetical protein